MPSTVYFVASGFAAQEGLSSLSSGGVTPGLLIIDDGWQSTDVDPPFQKGALSPTKLAQLLHLPESEQALLRKTEEDFYSESMEVLAEYAAKLPPGSSASSSMPVLSNLGPKGARQQQQQHQVSLQGTPADQDQQVQPEEQLMQKRRMVMWVRAVPDVGVGSCGAAAAAAAAACHCLQKCMASCGAAAAVSLLAEVHGVRLQCVPVCSPAGAVVQQLLCHCLQECMASNCSVFLCASLQELVQLLLDHQRERLRLLLNPEPASPQQDDSNTSSTSSTLAPAPQASREEDVLLVARLGQKVRDGFTVPQKAIG
eukprot:1158046-Pelagomonas_calceolata.AAC.8